MITSDDRYLSVMDKTRHYYTLCRAASPIDTPPPGTPTKQTTPTSVIEVQDEGVPEMEYEDEFDQTITPVAVTEENLEPIVEVAEDDEAEASAETEASVR